MARTGLSREELSEARKPEAPDAPDAAAPPVRSRTPHDTLVRFALKDLAQARSML